MSYLAVAQEAGVFPEQDQAASEELRGEVGGKPALLSFRGGAKPTMGARRTTWLRLCAGCILATLSRVCRGLDSAWKGTPRLVVGCWLLVVGCVGCWLLVFQ
jgi:hypothetical protein